RHGIAASEVLDVVGALGGLGAGEILEEARRVPIRVRIADRFRTDPEAIGRIPVTASNGDRIPLALLARIRSVEGPTTIQHEWAKRRIVVQASARGRDVGGFVADAASAIAERGELPPGYYVRFGGQVENLEGARKRLAVVVPTALALIFALLFVTYGRILDAARVFAGVPFAAVGGVLALFLRGIPFSLSAAVGFVALSGVSVLGDMVLVSTIRQYLARGTPLRDAVVLAATARLRPVLI